MYILLSKIRFLISLKNEVNIMYEHKEKRKKNQHTVPQFYLKEWVRSSATQTTLSCLQITKHEIKPRNPQSISASKYFYELNDLIEEDIILLKKILRLKNLSPKLEKAEYERIENLNKLMQRKKLFKLAKSSPTSDKNLNALKMFTGEELDIQSKNLEENLYAKLETKAKPIIKELVSGESNFYDNLLKRSTFFYFIAMQFFRTKRQKDAILTAYKRQIKKDVEHIWIHLASIHASDLLMKLNYLNMVLLVNNTETPFITSDNPVLVKEYYENLYFPIESEVYYPVSPKVAIILTQEKQNLFKNYVSQQDVVHFNDLIAAIAFEEVYADNEEVLKGYQIKLQNGDMRTVEKTED